MMLKYQKSMENTSDYYKITNDILDSKIKEKELVNEFDISNLVKNSDLNKNVSKKSRIKSRARKYCET